MTKLLLALIALALSACTIGFIPRPYAYQPDPYAQLNAARQLYLQQQQLQQSRAQTSALQALNPNE
jgi:hypothetical protein